VPLALLFVAAYLPDILETEALLVGWPTGNPMWSHMLIVVAATAVVVAVGWGLWRRDWRGALILGGVTLVHWPLDVITYLKPTWPGGPTVGLLQYEWPLRTLAIEAVLLYAAWRLA